MDDTVRRPAAGGHRIHAAARLVPFRRRTTPREPGLWRGSVTLAEDFDRTPESVIDDFEG